MMDTPVYLAVDLGAGSGRVVAGLWKDGALSIEIVHRFESKIRTLPESVHWDLPAIFGDIVEGLRLAGGRWGAAIRSIAVDAWGVDYGLLDANGQLLHLPYMYRDSRTDGWMDRMAGRMPRREIYDRTGIQFLPFNTLYQLAAEFDSGPETAGRAQSLLFIPDLVAFWLTGEKTIERTIAGTSQLLKAGSSEWDSELAAAAGIPSHLLGRVTEPGERIGELLPEIRRKTGLGAVPVIACGAHDTASAVIGVPAATAQPLFLSSGTWSLVGRETEAPVVNDLSYAGSFSNEHGVLGTNRLLKNVSGMWLLQECLRCWEKAGESRRLESLLEEAGSLDPEMRLDPNDPAFLHPEDMPAEIQRSLRTTGQREASSKPEMVAVVLRSLADCYGRMFARIRDLSGDLPDTLHIVGGGSQNRLLNQMTADATGLRVLAGPTEATALGNLVVQLLAAGEIASIAEGRAIIRKSFPLEEFVPAAGVPEGTLA